MIKLAVLAVILCGTFVSAGLQVDSCKELLGPRQGTYGTGKIEDVRVSDCADTPCKLRKGRSTTIEFDFQPDKDYTSLNTAVFGTIGVIKVPFRDVHGFNACANITRKEDGMPGCPLRKGVVYTYSNTFPILKTYPAVNVNVQYGLNDKKNQVICWTLPAKIVAA